MKFTVNFYTKSFGQTNIGHNLNLWGIFFYQNVILKISKLSGVHHNQKLSSDRCVKAWKLPRWFNKSRNYTEPEHWDEICRDRHDRRNLFLATKYFFRNKNYYRILLTWCVIWSKKIVLLQGWITWGYAATMQCREPSKDLVSWWAPERESEWARVGMRE